MICLNFFNQYFLYLPWVDILTFSGNFCKLQRTWKISKTKLHSKSKILLVWITTLYFGEKKETLPKCRNTHLEFLQRNTHILELDNSPHFQLFWASLLLNFCYHPCWVLHYSDSGQLYHNHGAQEKLFGWKSLVQNDRSWSLCLVCEEGLISSSNSDSFPDFFPSHGPENGEAELQ